MDGSWVSEKSLYSIPIIVSPSLKSTLQRVGNSFSIENEACAMIEDSQEEQSQSFY